MKKFVAKSLLILGLLVPVVIQAQVIESSPTFPKDSDNINITFHSDRGSKGLMTYTGDVYMHTGVITDKSTSGSDWKYVKTNWGVNTPETKLTKIVWRSYVYEIQINNPRVFYGVPEGEKILQIAFVFRSADGTKTGKDDGDKDIFQTVYDAGLNVRFNQPSGNYNFVNVGEKVSVSAEAGYSGTETVTLKLFLNGESVTSLEGTTLSTDLDITQAGNNELMLVGTDGTISDTARTAVFGLSEPVNEARPEGIVDGINKTGPNSVTLSLYAPQKQNIFVIGDFNDWKPTTEHMMNKYVVNNDSVHFWLEINNLDPTTEYAFQYLIDGKTVTGDPYSEKILDPWNDPWINEKYEAYPNIKPYPTGKTDTPVTVFQIQEDEYQWKVEHFQKPDKNSVVFYELLIRDFAAEATYRTLIDTLGYFKRLGVNAIKLMPVAEFDGNDSWGYNPAYHMALDKYYGSKNDLKEFIDSCHVNGIAVVLDMVFNHATGLSPLVRMYMNDSGAPSESSIYAFTNARHPYNVFNDLNHGSRATNYWFKRVLKHWIEEFKVDGFRFDLSKGHYIDNTTDVGVWSSYNQWRIDHWKDNYNYMKSIDPDFYVILEHLGDNSEEKVLAEHGLMLWGKMTSEYNEATMGWHENNKSEIKNAFHVSRGWSKANLVAYMESHDEERLMYKNRLYGNQTNASYNAQSIPVATDRMKTAGAFFFTIPGPKMMWMFGELGYDVSINQSVVDGPLSDGNRVSRKPILWDYYSDPDRYSLHETFGDLIKLRTHNPVFYDQATVTYMYTSSAYKRMELHHETNNVNIVGNFDVFERTVSFDFPQTGRWYDFFAEDSVEITDTKQQFTLQPGEFRIYSTTKFPKDYTKVDTSTESLNDETLPAEFSLLPVYPNPFNPSTTVSFDMPKSGYVSIDVFDMLGRHVKNLINANKQAGNHQIQLDASGLSSGVYLIQMRSGNFIKTQKALLIK